MWLQSESDVCAHDGKCIPQRGGKYYACAIQAMIKDWRAKFKLALPFLWVQISPWEGHEAATSMYELPEMRLAQMAANELPLTAMATAVDLGPHATSKGWDSGDEHGPDPWGNVHFRNKGPLGPRLSAAAMNIVYGNTSEAYRGPEAASATLVQVKTPRACSPTGGGSHGGDAATGVSIAFKDGTVGGGLEFIANQCPYEVLEKEAGMKTEAPDCTENITDCINKCGWWDIEMGNGNWHTNVTVAISGDTVVVSPPTDAVGCPVYSGSAATTPTGVRYLYADWPVATLYNQAGLPALPFVLAV